MTIEENDMGRWQLRIEQMNPSSKADESVAERERIKARIENMLKEFLRNEGKNIVSTIKERREIIQVAVDIKEYKTSSEVAIDKYYEQKLTSLEEEKKREVAKREELQRQVIQIKYLEFFEDLEGLTTMEIENAFEKYLEEKNIATTLLEQDRMVEVARKMIMERAVKSKQKIEEKYNEIRVKTLEEKGKEIAQLQPHMQKVERSPLKEFIHKKVLA